MIVLEGFALGSAVTLFYGILTHLTSVGTGWAGLVSISMVTITLHASTQPLRWFLMSELAPVYHLPWSVSISSALVWALNLASVILFPIVIQV